jgi:hypothetical protein
MLNGSFSYIIIEKSSHEIRRKRANYNYQRKYNYPSKYFLNEAGEFHPFGAVVDSTDKERTMGVSGEDEFPDPNDVIDDLEKALRSGLVKGDFKIGGIGIDMYMPLKDNAGKVTGLEIRIININGLIAKYRYPYFAESAKEVILYDEIIVEENF